MIKNQFLKAEKSCFVCLLKFFVNSIKKLNFSFLIFKVYFRIKFDLLYRILDVPKKRIPRAEFHGIFLDFVECWIAKKFIGPYYCLKRRISTLKSWNSVEVKLKFRLLGRNTDFPLYGQFNIPQNPKIFHGIRPVESAF